MSRSGSPGVGGGRRLQHRKDALPQRLGHDVTKVEVHTGWGVLGPVYAPVAGLKEPHLDRQAKPL